MIFNDIKIKDEVRVDVPCKWINSYNWLDGAIGFVIEIDTEDEDNHCIAIDFGKDIDSYFHSCGGLLEGRTGYWFFEDEENTPPIAWLTKINTEVEFDF
ncbi:MAG: hypothetical protein RR744_00425 [Cellulosilyticaceae bacterium]